MKASAALTRKSFAALTRCAVLLGSAWLSCCAVAPAQSTPPWSKGANNPAPQKGFEFQVDSVDDVPDLHGNPTDAKLVLFIGGNQFFVLPRLIAGFEAQHPELKGRIFYETLPPGILRKQMANDDTLTLGNLTLQVKPDVYEAGQMVLQQMEKEQLVEKPISYATNDLAIMVPAANPQRIASLADLGKPGIRLAMPNPEWEGVARQIKLSLGKAGGDTLVKKVYEDKAANGETYLTHIHHRQTPMRLMMGQSDAGVTWASEVRFQKMIGNPISGIAIPEAQNTTAIYAAGVLRNAPHAEAAHAWVRYLLTPAALAIYQDYGFKPYVAGPGK